MAEGQEKSTVSLVKEDVSAAGLQVKPTIDNFYRLIENHYGSNLRLNVMTGKPEYWDHRKKLWCEWTDAEESRMRAYFERQYSMYSQVKMTDAMLIYWNSHKVNPLTDLLESLVWDGKSPQLAVLEELPKHLTFHKGDTIVTSGYSAVFPPGILVGKVTKLENSDDGLSYRLRVLLSTDFANLRDVCVIDDKAVRERLDLLRQANDSIQPRKND